MSSCLIICASTFSARLASLASRKKIFPTSFTSWTEANTQTTMWNDGPGRESNQQCFNYFSPGSIALLLMKRSLDDIIWCQCSICSLFTNNKCGLTQSALFTRKPTTFLVSSYYCFLTSQIYLHQKDQRSQVVTANVDHRNIFTVVSTMHGKILNVETFKTTCFVYKITRLTRLAKVASAPPQLWTWRFQQTFCFLAAKTLEGQFEIILAIYR